MKDYTAEEWKDFSKGAHGCVILHPKMVRYFDQIFQFQDNCNWILFFLFVCFSERIYLFGFNDCLLL